jgi:drug/metabolite transporter (DMT)-like permease
MVDMPSSVEPQRAAGVYAKGALFGLTAVSIWAGWIVVARLGLRTSLAPEDITAIRFAVAGLILLPYLLRRGLALDRLGWRGVVLLAIGGGAPMVLLANVGLTFAPAAHAGALFPGAMPLLVALIAVPVLGETFSPPRRVGLVLILAGVVGLLLAAGLTVGTRQTAGDAMFLGAALLWAVYTVCLRKAAISGMHAAAIAAVASLVLYLPIYLLLHGDRLLGAPIGDVALQALVQGLLTAVVSLILYGRAVEILGASSGAAFAAICPVLTALFGIALLSEMPTPAEWVTIATISSGVYLVTGGPLPRWQRRH